MKNKIVNELITAMKARVPEKQNLAGYLADTLCMGKEAVYRRLRGEVSFTLEEVALISRRLGISIDQIIGNHLSDRVTFDLNLLKSSDSMEGYYEIIHRYLQIFDYVKRMKQQKFILLPICCRLLFILNMSICLNFVFAVGFIRMVRSRLLIL